MSVPIFYSSSGEMDPAVFDGFRELIHKTSGIFLSENKVSLLLARIGKRMRTKGLSSPGDYLQSVLADRSGSELGELLNAISTNVTYFFREALHFEFLAKKTRARPAGETGPFRIWCAACSTGEEPYSIAMTALENMANPANLEIIASDISTKVLQIAKFGVYKGEETKGIGPALLKKYFQVGTGKARDFLRAKDILRDRITFKQINLSTPPFPIEGLVDIVFCRNVMIYFNDELKKQLLHDFHAKLKPGGMLVVGLAESLSGRSKKFQSIGHSVYAKVP